MLDYNGTPIPLLPTRTSETLTTSGTSQQSSMLTTKAARIVCLQDCWYQVGKEPTADNTGTSVFLPANVVETVAVEVPGNMKIAVISDGVAGEFNITTLGT
jgi:hypothetical protein